MRSDGSASFVVRADQAGSGLVKLSAPARKLLARQRTLKAQITITLTNAAHRRSVSRRTLTLGT